MNRLFFVTLLIFTTFNLCRGQKMVIEEPKMLTDSINSAAEDIFPLLSPDGQTLYFARTFYPQNTGGEKAGQDIWYSKQDTTGKWQKAHNLTTLNTINNNVVVGISSNEDTLYLLNTYSSPLRQKRGIAYALRTENSWDEPKELDLVFRNEGEFKAYYVTPDEKVIIMSTNGANSYGEEDLYVYLKEKGKWSKPIHLNETINTPGFEISPFLTKDKDTLFFASTGHPGQGDADIFMAKRLDSTWTKWSTPVNMGKKINSSGFDAYFSLSPTGEAFFSSNRNSKFSNIYITNITFKTDSVPPPQEPDTTVVAVDTLPKKTVVEETFYTVQILALKSREAPEKNFFYNLDLDLINMYVGKDGFNRFSIGQYDTFSLAVDAMKKLRNTGYPDAFVRKIERYTELSVRQGEKVIDYYKAKKQGASRFH